MWETVNDCMLQPWFPCARQIKQRRGKFVWPFMTRGERKLKRDRDIKQRNMTTSSHFGFAVDVWRIAGFFHAGMLPALSLHVLASCSHLLVKGLLLSPVSVHFPQGLHWSGNMALLTPLMVPSFTAPSMTLPHAFNSILNTFLVSWSLASSLNVFILIKAVRKQVTGHTRLTCSSKFKPGQIVGFSAFA